MNADDHIRRALEARADQLDTPPPALDAIHRDAVARRRPRRGLLAAAAIVLVVLAVAAVAWRAQDDTSRVTSGPPGTEEPDLPDPSTVAYIPSFVSDLADDVSKELDLTPTEGGYRLVATTTTGTYTFTFERATRTTSAADEPIGTSAAFVGGKAEPTGARIEWTDAVGTVSLTVSDSARTELERVAQSIVLVDLPTYEQFLDDPEAPVEGAPVPLVFGDLDVGTVRWGGEITGDGLTLRTTGQVRGGGSASLGVVQPTELGSWKAGDGAYQLLRVPADFGGITFTKGSAEVVGTVDDPTVGPIVLLHTPTRDPVEYQVTSTGGRPAQPYSICVECS